MIDIHIRLWLMDSEAIQLFAMKIGIYVSFYPIAMTTGIYYTYMYSSIVNPSVKPTFL